MRLPAPFRLFLPLLLIALAGCGQQPLNSPYPAGEKDANTLYAAFAERPKHLDPAVAYNSNEYVFIQQVYEPPLQYHYLRRPYTLVPLSATDLPRTTLLDATGKALPADADPTRAAASEYEIRIRPGIRYAPHPAFARDDAGKLRYHHLDAAALGHINTLTDFTQSGSRELTAADYVYQIKRLASPRVQSPISGLLQAHIAGFDELTKTLAAADGGTWLDLRRFDLAGVQAVDRYTLRIRLNDVYPQFMYWLAMPFFAPLPWEADRLLQPARPGRQEHQPGLVPGRHRAVHADRERPEPAHGAGAQSAVSRRALPHGWRTGRRRRWPAGRRRQADAVHRPGRVQPGAREHPGVDQVPAGLLRPLGGRPGQLRPGREPGRRGRARN